MGNFDVNTGVVSGYSGSRTPGPDMTEEYLDFVNRIRGGGGDTIGYPKSTNIINMGDISKGESSADIVNKEANRLPNLTLYLIENPLVKTLVYTDSNGNSKIIYTTPKSPVQLIPYGSKFATNGAGPVKSSGIPPPTETKVIVQDQQAPNASSTSSGGGGLGFLSLSCCSSMCMIGCGVLITLALKK